MENEKAKLGKAVIEDKPQGTEKKENESGSEKLSYEQLQHILYGMNSRVNALENENKNLKGHISELQEFIAEQQTQSIFAYLSVAQKVLDQQELFNTDFIHRTVEDVMMIMDRLRAIIVLDETNDKENGEGAQTE